MNQACMAMDSSQVLMSRALAEAINQAFAVRDKCLLLFHALQTQQLAIAIVDGFGWFVLPGSEPEPCGARCLPLPKQE